MTNPFDEYEAEIAAKERAAIEAEDAAWAALTPDQQRQALQDKRRAQVAEAARQRRIAKQHDEMFGPDDDEEGGEE
jgi:ribosomal protein L14E/L6E/L27E